MNRPTHRDIQIATNEYLANGGVINNEPEEIALPSQIVMTRRNGKGNSHKQVSYAKQIESFIPKSKKGHRVFATESERERITRKVKELGIK